MVSFEFIDFRFPQTDQAAIWKIPELIAAGSAAIGAAVTPLAAAPVLGMVGFGAAGPVAGTIAAGIQAGIGNVGLGSSFALAQSIAMGGAAVPFFGVAIGATIAGGAAYGAAALLL